MIQLSTAEPLRWTPPWREGDPSAPVYFLRAGSIIDRGRLEAELAGEHRAGRVFAGDVLRAIRSGIETLLADDPEQELVLALIDQEVSGEPMAEAERQTLDRVRAILADCWQPYRDLVAQQARRAELTPILAFRRLCTDWCGPEVEYKRGRDGCVVDAAMAELDWIEMISAGNQAYLMLFGGGSEGNSAPRSPSDSDRQTSNSDAPSKAAGKSAKPGGPKTPVSSSRRTSGRS